LLDERGKGAVVHHGKDNKLLGQEKNNKRGKKVPPFPAGVGGKGRARNGGGKREKSLKKPAVS